MPDADIDNLQLADLVPAAKAIAAGDGRQWDANATDDDVICWYEAFLHCRLKHDGDRNRKEKFVAISRMADDLWHAHILRTQRYTDDTTRIFGHYLHHTPKDNVDQDTPQFLADRDEYVTECQNQCGKAPPMATPAVGMATTAGDGGGGLVGVPPDIVHICS